MNGIVELDVGGKIFKTNITTLILGSGYFNSMFGSSWKESCSLEPIFIDRDSGTFEIILKYLRTGKLYVESTNTLLLKELVEEAEYFQIPELVNAVQDIKTSLTYDCRTVYDVCLPNFVAKGWEIIREFRAGGDGEDSVYVGDKHCEACGEVVNYDSNDPILTTHGIFANKCITIRRAIKT